MVDDDVALLRVVREAFTSCLRCQVDTSPAPSRRRVEKYVNEHYPADWRKRISQFLANTDDLEAEEQRFPAQVVDAAVRWLERNREHPRIFLWIDSFDPHEPWDPPAHFDVYGDPGYDGPRLIMPMGGQAAGWAGGPRSAL